MKVQNICLYVQYNGKNYLGWQKQKYSPKTIQEKIETAIYKRSDEKIQVLASGRTDAGVHARKQAVWFKYRGNREIQLNDWVRGMNVFLPKDIRILKACYVEEGFHPIASVKKKTYRYFFRMGEGGNMFLNHCVVSFSQDLNLKKIEEGLSLFVGKKSFHSFQTASDPKKETVRTVFDLKLVKMKNSSIYYFEISGKGFLRHMVRRIVGALIALGREKTNLAEIKKAFMEGQKIKVGSTVAPEGLFLWDVRY